MPSNNKAKQAADKQCQIPKKTINTGEKVYAKRGKRDHKFQTNYLPVEFTVTEIKGTQVENNQAHQTYKRHISFIKLIQKRYDNKERRADPDVIKTPSRKQYPIR